MERTFEEMVRDAYNQWTAEERLEYGITLETEREGLIIAIEEGLEEPPADWEEVVA